jgi:hypothetical protein
MRGVRGKWEGGIVTSRQEFEETVEKVKAALVRIGGPSKVLPACLYVCAAQAQSAGTSVEEFVVSMLPLVLAVFGEEFDPAKMAAAIADVAERHARESGPPLDAYERALVAGIRRGRGGGESS